jgi:farnesyl-diphosphate farnesyltransferase
MCDFAERKVKTIADYNLYCHYVAGLVGIGLSKIFSCSGLEAPEVAKSEALANSMGLFLQKTNIIRDYLEDAVDGRSFWPPEIWCVPHPPPPSFPSPPILPFSLSTCSPNFLIPVLAVAFTHLN